MAVILAIESSCDDTSAAILENGIVLSNLIANQLIHKDYGGVVPELASRAHQENIIPVVKMALSKAGKSIHSIDAVAITRGPGLLGSLLVGMNFAKSLAYSLNKPLIEVNHMQAHVLAHFADLPHPSFPFLCLTVSGGHTQIVLVRDHLDMEVLGTTIDDAAGEAFDKSGKLLGLTYPAGPQIDKLAKAGIDIFKFAEPQIAGLDFSFSGLKTSILYFLNSKIKEQPDFLDKNLHSICASIQATIIRILLKKLEKAADDLGIRTVAIAGGVSANSGLRQAVDDLGKRKNWAVFIPKFEYCTDNAGMIAVAAHYKYLKSEFAGLDIIPLARYPFGIKTSLVGHSGV